VEDTYPDPILCNKTPKPSLEEEDHLVESNDCFLHILGHNEILCEHFDYDWSEAGILRSENHMLEGEAVSSIVIVDLPNIVTFAPDIKHQSLA